MKLSPKQLIGQKVLAQHQTLKIDRITLMYAPTTVEEATKKMCIIVSVSKKITPKAVHRNYNKRVLRALLREIIPSEKRSAYNWMWVCKESLITKELRLKLQEALSKLPL